MTPTVAASVPAEESLNLLNVDSPPRGLGGGLITSGEGCLEAAADSSLSLSCCLNMSPLGVQYQKQDDKKQSSIPPPTVLVTYSKKLCATVAAAPSTGRAGCLLVGMGGFLLYCVLLLGSNSDFGTFFSFSKNRNAKDFRSSINSQKLLIAATLLRIPRRLKGEWELGLNFIEISGVMSWRILRSVTACIPKGFDSGGKLRVVRGIKGALNSMIYVFPHLSRR